MVDVPVDVERLLVLLRRFDGKVTYLAARAGEDRAALRADEQRLSGLKYRFVTALETLVNNAQHSCASQGRGPLTSNAASVVLLGEHGVVGVDLARSLAGAVGFRDVLVHQYAEVDDDRVVANLDGVAGASRGSRG